MYQAFNIGTRFRILPPGHPPSTDGRIDLVMQRGAFGSGEHETTRSCLEILERLPGIVGAQVLDLGSGTGILALAALKLGARRAVCIDIEAAAVETARVNGRLNGLADRLTHVTGTLEALTEEGFDLTLANIYGDVLLAVAHPLVRKTRAGGILLLSGIAWEYNFDVRQAYATQGCTIVRNQLLDEFSTLVLRRDADQGEVNIPIRVLRR